VPDGLAAAAGQARAAAGDRDVYVMGGGRTVAGCLATGLLDQLRIHLSPEVPGAGTPLFGTVGRHRLRQVRVKTSPVATHLTYDVLRG
jgi:dihydrofolate reductase